MTRIDFEDNAETAMHEYCGGGVPVFMNAFADMNRSYNLLSYDTPKFSDCELIDDLDQNELKDIVWKCILNEGNSNERYEDYENYTWITLRQGDNLYILPEGGW